jgi:hypothetical protein
MVEIAIYRGTFVTTTPDGKIREWKQTPKQLELYINQRSYSWK